MLMALFDTMLPAIRRIRRPFSSLEERRWPLVSLDRSVGSGLRIRLRARVYTRVCAHVCVKYLARMREEFF